MSQDFFYSYFPVYSLTDPNYDQQKQVNNRLQLQNFCYFDNINIDNQDNNLSLANSYYHLLQKTAQQAQENFLLPDQQLIFVISARINCTPDILKKVEQLYKVVQKIAQIDFIDLCSDVSHLLGTPGIIINQQDYNYCGVTGYKPIAPLAFLIRKNKLLQLINQQSLNSTSLTSITPPHFAKEYNFADFIDLEKILVNNYLLETNLSNLEPSWLLTQYFRRNNHINSADLVNQLINSFQNNHSAQQHTNHPEHKLNIPAYVLTLQQTPDRLIRFKQNPHSQQITHIYGIHHQDMSELQLQQFDQQKLVNYCGKRAGKIEIACALSHRLIYQHIIDNPQIDEQQLVLVVEDDIKLNPNWVEQINLLNYYLQDYHEIELIYGGHFSFPDFHPMRNQRYHPILKKIVSDYPSTVPMIDIGSNTGLGMMNEMHTIGSFCYLLRKSAMRRALNQRPWLLADMFCGFIEIDRAVIVNPVLAVVDFSIPSIVAGDRMANPHYEGLNLIYPKQQKEQIITDNLYKIKSHIQYKRDLLSQDKK